MHGPVIKLAGYSASGCPAYVQVQIPSVRLMLNNVKKNAKYVKNYKELQRKRRGEAGRKEKGFPLLNFINIFSMQI